MGRLAAFRRKWVHRFVLCGFRDLGLELWIEVGEQIGRLGTFGHKWVPRFVLCGFRDLGLNCGFRLESKLEDSVLLVVNGFPLRPVWV